MEGASTNLALQSAAVGTGAAWSSNAQNVAGPIIAGNAAVAPDGTTTASEIQIPAVPSGSNYSQVYQPITFSAGINTHALYVRGKSASGTTYLYMSSGSAPFAACNFVTTVWTKCLVTGTPGAGAGFIFIGGHTEVGVGTPATLAVDFYAWGEQLEQQPFATSYISTGASTASRAADVVSTVNPLPNTGAAWCVYETITPEGGRAWGDGTSSVDAVIGSIGGPNSFYGQIAASAVISTNTYDGSAQTTAGSSNNSFVAGSTHRIGHCYAPGPVLTNYFDGVAQTTTIAGAVTNMAGQSTPIYIGSYTSGFQARAWISDVCVGGAGACH